MYMIFDLLISMLELFISETSDCKCNFLRQENLASFIGCVSLVSHQLNCLCYLTVTGVVSAQIRHGYAAGCDMHLPCQHNFRLCLIWRVV